MVIMYNCLALNICVNDTYARFVPRLFTMNFEGPMGCCEGDTFADLRVRLATAGVVVWPFQFWDYVGQCHIKIKMEWLNLEGSNVHIVKCLDVVTDVVKRTFQEAF